MMFKFFKRKYRVPVDELLFEQLAPIYMNLGRNSSLYFYDWIEKEYGIKREYSWRKEMNYLVFDSERDFLVFMLKL